MSFTGIWPALVSPLDVAGNVDVRATERLVELLLQADIGGLYVCGGTGEGVLLSREQRRQIAETVVGVVGGQVPVMVHIGALTTREAVALAQDAVAVGADAISAVPPFYYAYTFEAIKSHYRALATATALPLYVYYIPGATGNPMTVAQLLEICGLDGVAGFKYTSQDMLFFSEVMAQRDMTRVNVLSGPDELCMLCQMLGADGAIGTTYNIAPRLFSDIRAATLAGKVVAARELHWRANRIIQVLHKYGVIPGIKAALRVLGIDVGQGVPPMPPITGETLHAFERDMRTAGLFELRDRPALSPQAGDAARGRLA
ncbi:MAG: dihydrodipicolinate synthase family protein [Chloroflexi bacterium]|nr:dihydrodipicolinate synthase family protein [Chloroflexota bacterium]